MFGNMFRNVKALPLRRSRLGFHGKRGAGGSNARVGQTPTTAGMVSGARARQASDVAIKPEQEAENAIRARTFQQLRLFARP